MIMINIINIMNIGYNISGSINDYDLFRVIQDEANSIQIFTSDPCNFNTKPFNLDDNVNFFLKSNNIKTVIHGSFLINLARKPDDKICINSINLLKRDLKICNKINAIGVVIHMGKDTQNLGYDNAIDTYISNLNNVLATTEKGIIILETGAGCGREVASRLNELGRIRTSCIDKNRIKFCIDTCHIYASGYDLTDDDFVDTLENYIEITLGWENVIVAHINDSKDLLNSKKDRHGDISCGYISQNNINSFMKFISYFVKRNIPIILETPCDKKTYGEQINLIKKYIKE
jgi:deoxyribonuclease-4